MAKTASFDLKEVMEVVRKAAGKYSIKMRVEFDDLFQEIMLAWIVTKADIDGLERWVFGKAKQKASDLFNAEQRFRNAHEFVFTNGMVEDLLWVQDPAVMKFARDMSEMHKARIFGYYVDGRTVEGQSKEYQAVRYSLSCLTNKMNIAVSGRPDDNKPGARRSMSNASSTARIEQEYGGEYWSPATSGRSITW